MENATLLPHGAEVCVQFGLLMLFALGTGVITAPGRLELVS